MERALRAVCEPAFAATAVSVIRDERPLGAFWRNKKARPENRIVARPRAPLAAKSASRFHSVRASLKVYFLFDAFNPDDAVAGVFIDPNVRLKLLLFRLERLERVHILGIARAPRGWAALLP